MFNCMVAVILPTVETAKMHADGEEEFPENKCINNPDFIILTM